MFDEFVVVLVEEEELEEDCNLRLNNLEVVLVEFEEVVVELVVVVVEEGDVEGEEVVSVVIEVFG